jgi:hypothetical protein
LLFDDSKLYLVSTGFVLALQRFAARRNIVGIGFIGRSIAGALLQTQMPLRIETRLFLTCSKCEAAVGPAVVALRNT